MSKFKLNARLFGGLGFIAFILIIILPVWAGFLETGVIGDASSNLVQVAEGQRPPIFLATATIPLLIGMVVSFIAFVFLYRHKRRRDRS